MEEQKYRSKRLGEIFLKKLKNTAPAEEENVVSIETYRIPETAFDVEFKKDINELADNKTQEILKNTIPEIYLKNIKRTHIDEVLVTDTNYDTFRRAARTITLTKHDDIIKNFVFPVEDKEKEGEEEKEEVNDRSKCHYEFMTQDDRNIIVNDDFFNTNRIIYEIIDSNSKIYDNISKKEAAKIKAQREGLPAPTTKASKREAIEKEVMDTFLQDFIIYVPKKWRQAVLQYGSKIDSYVVGMDIEFSDDEKRIRANSEFCKKYGYNAYSGVRAISEYIRYILDEHCTDDGILAYEGYKQIAEKLNKVFPFVFSFMTPEFFYLLPRIIVTKWPIPKEAEELIDKFLKLVNSLDLPMPETLTSNIPINNGGTTYFSDYFAPGMMKTDDLKDKSNSENSGKGLDGKLIGEEGEGFYKSWVDARKKIKEISIKNSGAVVSGSVFHTICIALIIKFDERVKRFSIFDIDGYGYLSSYDLELLMYEKYSSILNYIYGKYMKSNPENCRMMTDLATKIVMNALSKENPLRVKISDLLKHQCFIEFFKSLGQSEMDYLFERTPREINVPPRGDLSSKISHKSVFSFAVVEDLISMYTMAADGNSIVTREKFRRLNMFNFTDYFVDRVFNIFPVDVDERNKLAGFTFNTFFDIIIPIVVGPSPGNSRLIIKVLDRENKGYISYDDVRTFLTEVIIESNKPEKDAPVPKLDPQYWSKLENVYIPSVIDEIWDGIKITGMNIPEKGKSLADLSHKIIKDERIYLSDLMKEQSISETLALFCFDSDIATYRESIVQAGKQWY